MKKLFKIEFIVPLILLFQGNIAFAETNGLMPVGGDFMSVPAVVDSIVQFGFFKVLLPIYIMVTMYGGVTYLRNRKDARKTQTLRKLLFTATFITLGAGVLLYFFALLSMN